MAKDAVVEISAEAFVHRAMRGVVRGVAKQFGIRIQSVQVEWDEPKGKSGKVRKVSIRTES